jgi:hypothetical protein
LVFSRSRPQASDVRWDWYIAFCVGSQEDIMSSAATVFSQSFFHGTRADLTSSDLIVVGYQSNFTDLKPLSWVYFSATLAAIWGAELAIGTHENEFML